jgi:hypothetical protein
VIPSADFIPYVIGGAQLATLLGIFLRLGRIGATLEDHATRLLKLEQAA